jgi:two-component system OmpR family response regulator
MTGAMILVVEDDPTIARNIVRGLRAADFEVELVSRGDLATEALRRVDPALVVLDLNLPGMTGEQLLAAWSGRTKVPVIVLTARIDLDDRLRVFELGAVDFLPKPFWVEELVARVRARLGRADDKPKRLLVLGDVQVDLDGRRALRDGQDLGLTPHELNVLVYLVERAERACSRAQIAQAVLSVEEDVDPRTVDSHVTRLRKKLGPTASCVETVWGVGYRVVLPKGA